MSRIIQPHIRQMNMPQDHGAASQQTIALRAGMTLNKLSWCLGKEMLRMWSMKSWSIWVLCNKRQLTPCSLQVGYRGLCSSTALQTHKIILKKQELWLIYDYRNWNRIEIAHMSIDLEAWYGGHQQPWASSISRRVSWSSTRWPSFHFIIRSYPSG